MSKTLTQTLKGQRVVVIGGGLAGLTAARDLAMRGADVQVIEARKRLGGRVWTVVDREFSDTPLEMGGELIEGEHAELRSLCHELKLTLTPVHKEGFGLALDVNGRVQVMTGQRQIWSDYKQALAHETEALRDTGWNWNSTTAALIARHSLQSLLRARGASREVLAMAQSLRGFFLADPDELSALIGAELAMLPNSPGELTMSRIKGGNDRLVQALAKQKGVKIALESVVTRIEHDDAEVRVVVADGSKRGTVIKGDYLVLAIPATVARSLDMSPAPPSSLRRAWQALLPGPATKAHVRFDKGWWRKPGRPRAWATNLDSGALWEHSGTGPACLTLLAGGRASGELRRLLEESGPQRVIRRLSFLGEPEEARDFRSMSWELDPFARGGYVAFGTDFKPEWRAEMARAIGRMVMAGDHTSRKWQGYMNGAVESGQRAAREIELMKLTDLN